MRVTLEFYWSDAFCQTLVKSSIWWCGHSVIIILDWLQIRPKQMFCVITHILTTYYWVWTVLKRLRCSSNFYVMKCFFDERRKGWIKCNYHKELNMFSICVTWLIYKTKPFSNSKKRGGWTRGFKSWARTSSQSVVNPNYLMTCVVRHLCGGVLFAKQRYKLTGWGQSWNRGGKARKWDHTQTCTSDPPGCVRERPLWLHTKWKPRVTQGRLIQRGGERRRRASQSCVSARIRQACLGKRSVSLASPRPQLQRTEKPFSARNGGIIG